MKAQASLRATGDGESIDVPDVDPTAGRLDGAASRGGGLLLCAVYALSPGLPRSTPNP